MVPDHIDAFEGLAGARGRVHTGSGPPTTGTPGQAHRRVGIANVERFRRPYQAGAFEVHISDEVDTSDQGRGWVRVGNVQPQEHRIVAVADQIAVEMPRPRHSVDAERAL